jgi:hypothetical protein
MSIRLAMQIIVSDNIGTINGKLFQYYCYAVSYVASIPF